MARPPMLLIGVGFETGRAGWTGSDGALGGEPAAGRCCRRANRTRAFRAFLRLILAPSRPFWQALHADWDSTLVQRYR